MSETTVDQIARAVLYEGFMLYPYRPSVKNRQRWTFGGIYPKAWSEAEGGSDAWTMRTECLVAGSQNPGIKITVRFLQLVNRTVGALPRPVEDFPAGADPEYRLVDELRVGDQTIQPWQEAVEREVELAGPGRKTFAFPRQRRVEGIRSSDGRMSGVIIRQQESLEGDVDARWTPLADDLLRLTVEIRNLTEAKCANREAATLHSLVSTHTILRVTGGQFISLMDPPEKWRVAAAACKNAGAWPVLAGDSEKRDTMLSSPIILYDYPQIAKESPGDLFDGTEIDEILTLRIMTMTDEEKRSAAAIDVPVREMMARTENLAREQLMNLHGTVRGMKRIERTDLNPGDRVILHPLGRADIFDIALEGMSATIVSVERDFENRVHVAVTIDDDPGKDLGATGQPGHRFFFGLEEVELIAAGRAE